MALSGVDSRTTSERDRGNVPKGETTTWANTLETIPVAGSLIAARIS